MKQSHAIAHIRHLSCLGMGGEMVIPRMLETLFDIVPGIINAFIWTDDQGLPVNMHTTESVPTVVDHIANNYHLFQRPGEMPVEAIVRGPLLTGNLLHWQRDSQHRRSLTYNEIFLAKRVTHSLDLVLRVGARSRGLAFVHRGATDPKFSAADHRLLGGLAPYFLHALDAAPAADADFVDSEDIALLLCDCSGRILASGPGAERMLFSATNTRIEPGGGARSLLGARPALVGKICRNLKEIRAGRAAPAPIARVTSPWGAFTFQAHALESRGPDDDQFVSVVIRREEPRAVRILGRLKALPLSARQREVALLVGLGRSPEVIQNELAISRGTYRRYVENIHLRLDVHSRAELMVALAV